jgi:hypothetical protein
MVAKHHSIQKNLILQPPSFNWMRVRLNSRAVLIGILIGFLLCSMAGRFAASHNLYKNFLRFHCYICPTSLYYPTFSQLVSLAQDGLRSDQTLVIVGGDSILNGAGQQTERLWTRRLQTTLGDKYLVRNFSFPGSYAFDGGYFVAEYLQSLGKKVIYVTDTNPGTDPAIGFDGIYGYLYDDAAWKGYLLRHGERQMALSNLRKSYRNTIEGLNDKEIGAWLDGWSYFEDLWTAVGYKYAFTVWTMRTPTTPWQARRRYDDNLVPPPEPLSVRFKNSEKDLDFLRSKFGEFIEMRGTECIRKESAFNTLKSQLASVSPETLRNDTLVILTSSCPNHLSLLSPTENRCNERFYKDCKQVWEAAGFRTLMYGDSFTDEDFFDGRHLSNEGGEKLAELVAKEVRTMSGEVNKH